MSGKWLGLLELLLVFGALVWFGYAQLRSVRRPPRRDPERDDDSA
ncbi:MAG: hypothetical protein QNJ91_02535 [Gammaproteobacteria bacterium]|nr:hypothetical protein [Gammaproteobacteria bacterium]